MSKIFYCIQTAYIEAPVIVIIWMDDMEIRSDLAQISIAGASVADAQIPHQSESGKSLAGMTCYSKQPIKTEDSQKEGIDRAPHTICGRPGSDAVR